MGALRITGPRGQLRLNGDMCDALPNVSMFLQAVYPVLVRCRVRRPPAISLLSVLCRSSSASS
jgi:hypothetical protein